MTADEVRIPESAWPKNVCTPLDIWDHLPLCGCGCPEPAIEVAHWLLASWCREYNHGLEFHESYLQFDQFHAHLENAHEGMYWLCIYALGDADLTEHGGGARTSWLTPKGEAVLRYLEIFGDDPDEWPKGMVDGNPNFYRVTPEQATRLGAIGGA